MKNQNSLVVLVVALLATTPIADAKESLTEFLSDGFDSPVASAEGGTKAPKEEKKAKKAKKAKGKKIANTEEDAAFLESVTSESAAEVGVAGDYEDYAERLAKTLAMLSEDQQTRIFD